jgi:hypothetical protein
MENNTQHIEFINQYLNKELSFNESEIFLNRLKTDSYFKNLYEDHMIFLEGLKRQTLKAEIKNARQQYLKAKWMKFGVISMVIITGLIITYFLLVNKNDVEVEPNETHNSEIILDSIHVKKELEQRVMINDTLPTKKEEIKKAVDTSWVKPEVKLISKEVFTKIPESFKVNTLKDTTIICNEGTKLIIKANSFVDVDNKPVQGNIDFQVTEYYKLSDMLLANLSTTSNEKQLETGGMLYVEAKKGNEVLKLKENTGIEIHFPTRGKKENMQLFSGTWRDGVMDWELQPNKIEISKDPIIEIIEEERFKVPFAVVEEPPIFPGCENLNKTERKKCTSEATGNFIKANFDESIAEGLDFMGKHLISMQFVISNKGEIIDIQVMASHIKFAQEGIRVLEAMPKMIPGRQRGKVVSVVYSFPMSFIVGNGLKINRNLINLKSRTTSDIEFEEKLKTKDISTITTQEVSNYVFSTSQLGWLNLDRFISTTNRVKYKLKIKKDGDIKVNMVFKSLNSILPSRYLEGFDFGYVPKDEEVVIVAIKQKEDKLYLDIIDSKTKANPDLEFNFKEMTIQEMKSELQKLNKLFE